jgi:hypothetical protein
MRVFLNRAQKNWIFCAALFVRFPMWSEPAEEVWVPFRMLVFRSEDRPVAPMDSLGKPLGSAAADMGRALSW